MVRQRIIIGTRGSALALVQARWVAAQLMNRHPELQVELNIIKTKGDKILDVPLAKVGGKGLFVKEIEDALLGGRADIAVHSMKDVPTVLPGGLFIAASPPREDYRDALITRTGGDFETLPPRARVGTSSLRRQAQLKHHRPDLRIFSLRGNIDTRLKKLETENLEAIVLAAAGLSRMNMTDRISQYFDPDIMLPAIAQGALGIEARINDDRVLSRIAFLHHQPTAVCVAAERAFLERMEGGCQVPLGALARLSPNERSLTLTGLVADPDGKRFLKDHRETRPDHAARTGRELADALLARGGAEIMAELYQA
jgi:hydroxymethylbilane synthase